MQTWCAACTYCDWSTACRDRDLAVVAVGKRRRSWKCDRRQHDDSADDATLVDDAASCYDGCNGSWHRSVQAEPDGTGAVLPVVLVVAEVAEEEVLVLVEGLWTTNGDEKR